MLLLGNAICFIGSIIMALSGLIKDKKKLLFVQTIQIFFYTAGNLLLGGISGAIVDAVQILRNIVCYKDKLNIFWKSIISILLVGLSLYFDDITFFSIFLLIASIVFVWIMDTKSIMRFK